ncbi:Cytochrome P450 [Amycolatopsis pretoriensis]|uniref:Cytochrome P450 n=1 Tax=Amycolatopsis pretoriensis TaxID=218821 RepID=A0A1H5RG35_9PSEU|nr:cytochrome P450 [Amycolatopsis pretoriensis]SEF37295.1 Cytochrome P450 [Amycolatopsis pretoriensis]
MTTEDLTTATALDKSYVDDLFGVSAQLREAGPVHRVVTPEGEPAWLVTRYADVRAALTDPALSLDNANARAGYRGSALPPALARHLLNTDPPDHARLRRLVGQAFTARRVDGLAAGIRTAADALLDGLAGQPGADLVSTYAAPLPMTVICDLLGVPTADQGRFREWTHILVDSAPDRGRRLRAAVAGIDGYTRDLIRRKRADPGDDLLSALVEARDVGDRLSEDELTSFTFVLFAAGYETSMGLISVGLLELLRRPALCAAVRADPARLPGLVEELLRFCVPAALATRRFALGPVEIGGVRIPPGDLVLLSLASANRDPEQFDHADELRPSRGPGHLAFGHGIHHCLGAPLARLEARIALDRLLARFPGLAPADPAAPPRWRPSTRTHGLLELPVTFGKDSGS